MEEEKPNIAVVRPGSKTSINEFNSNLFLSCLEENYCLNELSIDKKNDDMLVIDNVLSTQECEKICKFIRENENLTFWSEKGENDLETKMFRNAKTIEMEYSQFSDMIWKRISHLFNETFVDVGDDQTDKNWERELPGKWFPHGLNINTLFAFYPPSGSFAPHTDGRVVYDFNIRSFYSIIIYLKTIPPGHGGRTLFYNKNAVDELKRHEIPKTENKFYWTADKNLKFDQVEAVEGRMLIFHQSLVHEGEPVLYPYEKIIIRSDLMFERNPKICDEDQDREAYKIYREAEDLSEQGHIEESIKLFSRAIKLSPNLAKIMGL